MFVYVNFLCMYYYMMINLHHGHPCKPNGRQNGTHTYLLNTEQHLGSEKIHIMKNMREASTHGTITLPKQEH